MTNGEAMRIYDELKNISKCTGVIGWYVYKNMKILDDATFPYRQAHDDLVRKYGGTETDPVPKDKIALLVSELNEIASLELDIKLALMNRVQFERLIKEDKGLSAETMLIIDKNIVES